MPAEEDIRRTTAKAASSFDLKDGALMDSVLARREALEELDPTSTGKLRSKPGAWRVGLPGFRRKLE